MGIDLELPEPPLTRRRRIFRFLRRAMVPVGLLIAVPILVYGVIAYRYWSNRPRLARHFSAEWNRTILATPESERAWPRYRPVVMGLLDGQPDDWDGDPEAVLKNKLLAAFIASKADLLRQAREISRLPALGFRLQDTRAVEDAPLAYGPAQWQKIGADWKPEQPNENPQLMGILLVPQQELRNVARCLGAEALLAGKKRDGALATADLLAMVSVAQQMRESPFLVSELMSLACYEIALRTWGVLLSKEPTFFTPAHLRELEKYFAAFEKTNLHARLDDECAAFEDVVQRVYTDDGHGDGYFCAEELAKVIDGSEPDLAVKLMAPLATGRFLSRRQIMETYDRLRAEMEVDIQRPWWDTTASHYESELAKLAEDKRYALINLLMLRPRGIRATIEGRTQQRDALLVASAAVRYRQDHATWPPALADLVPGYLASTPPDRFTGNPLSYRLAGGAPVIYSWGMDQQDDEGQPAIVRVEDADSGFGSKRVPVEWRWKFVDQVDNELFGDWILWPINSPPVTKAE